MKWIIGTDEAGYGPNLGPLAISATAWPLPPIEGESAEPVDLFDYFQTIFRTPEEPSDDRIVVGDSKKIFHPDSGIQVLEDSVISLCAIAKVFEFDNGVRWNELLDGLSIRNQAELLPWYQNYDPDLPLQSQIERVGQRVIAAKHFVSEAAPKFRSALIEPAEFNQGCETLGNKATLLSKATLQLVLDTLVDLKKEHEVTGVSVVCDKHGGRKMYAGVLQSLFEESWVHVVDETPESSRYRLTWNDIALDFEFVAKGDDHYLPIAVASMVSKYLREVSMEAFNQYWQTEIPKLKPTAGYPADAKRFRRAIESKMNDLKLDEKSWWRLR